MLVRPFTILLLAIVSTFAQAVNKAPKLRRACLNIDDSTVTIEYSDVSDACGSFTEHHIYGSETGTTYTLLHKETALAGKFVSFKLPNTQGTWSFYFETRFLCNGVDVAYSDTISIDTKPPSPNEIDSVSVDIATQKLIVGWKKNAQPDTKGYRVYQYSGGINSTIGDTVETSFVVKNQPVTSKILITLAAFDSCNLFGQISEKHSAMVLTSSLDTCTKTANISWSQYVGWPIDDQTLYASMNGQPFVSVQSLGTSASSVSYTGINFGDSVCFFVRAGNNTSGRKTSSSNISCIKLNRPLLPKKTYLSEVTVAGKKQIKIEAMVDNQGLSDSIVLYRVDNGEVPISRKKLLQGNNFYSWTDNSVNTDVSRGTYFVRTFAPCLGGTSTSQQSNSILLKIENDILSWNEYLNWDGDVLEYNIYSYDGSTWNILTTTTDLTYENTDTANLCFYIEAVENQNSFGYSRRSKSNEVCAKRTPQFYVPTAINPLSGNNTLRVIGTSIDHSRSVMKVYNRWGGQIFKTNNVSEGWVLDYRSDYVPPGVYLYDIVLFDLNGNRHYLSGVVRVIR